MGVCVSLDAPPLDVPTVAKVSAVRTSTAVEGDIPKLRCRAPPAAGAAVSHTLNIIESPTTTAATSRNSVRDSDYPATHCNHSHVPYRRVCGGDNSPPLMFVRPNMHYLHSKRHQAVRGDRSPPPVALLSTRCNSTSADHEESHHSRTASPHSSCEPLKCVSNNPFSTSGSSRSLRESTVSFSGTIIAFNSLPPNPPPSPNLLLGTCFPLRTISPDTSSSQVVGRGGATSSGSVHESALSLHPLFNLDAFNDEPAAPNSNRALSITGSFCSGESRHALLCGEESGSSLSGISRNLPRLRDWCWEELAAVIACISNAQCPNRSDNSSSSSDDDDDDVPPTESKSDSSVEEISKAVPDTEFADNSAVRFEFPVNAAPSMMIPNREDCTNPLTIAQGASFPDCRQQRTERCASGLLSDNADTTALSSTQALSDAINGSQRCDTQFSSRNEACLQNFDVLPLDNKDLETHRNQMAKPHERHTRLSDIDTVCQPSSSGV